MENNPIKYSDLIAPDNSIQKAVEQLTELNKIYASTLDLTKKEAIQVLATVKAASGATESGRKAIAKSADDTQKLTKARQNLAFAESETARELVKIKNATKDANDMNKLALAIGKEEVTVLNMRNKSYTQISAQYRLNKIVLSQLSDEEIQASAANRELVKTTDALFNSMKKFQSSTGMNQLNVGNYGDFKSQTETLDNFQGKVDNLGSSLQSLASGQGGFGGVIDSIKAFDKTLMGLMLNPVFAVIAGVAAAGAAFKFWFDYNKGVAEATRLTQQFTGLTGDAAKSHRVEIQALADTYGKEFKDTLQAVDSLADRFGITQQEAAKIVKDGFVSGADSSAEFLNNLKEYPTFFKEAGLSASEFVAITSQANNSGLYSDKGIDTIKEGTIRLREMTVATRTALDGIGLSSKKIAADLESGQTSIFDTIKTVSARLGELPPQSAAVGTAIADIFGGPGEDAGLAYIQTLKDIDTNLDNVKTGAGELAQIQERQLNSQIELEKTIAALFDATGGTFEAMVANGKIFVNDTIVGMINGVVDLANYFVDLYNSSARFRALVISLGSTFDVIKSATGVTIRTLIAGFKAAGDVIFGLVTMDAGRFQKGIRDALELPQNVSTEMGAIFVDNFMKGVDKMSKKKARISLTLADGTTTNPIAAPKSGGSKTPPATAAELKEAKKLEELAAKQFKDLQALKRQHEDALLSLSQDGFDKQRKQVNLQYDRQIEDLKYRLKTEKDLTEGQKTEIKALAVVAEQQRENELSKITKAAASKDLEIQKERLSARLATTKEGSAAELKAKIEIARKEQEIELALNSARESNEQMDPELIKDKYKKQIDLLTDAYRSAGLDLFDLQQEQAQSEFDLLKKTEGEKTRYRLKAERDRLVKVLELNESLNNKMSETEVSIVKNTIKKLDKDIDQSVKDDRKNRDLFDMVGLKTTPENKKLATESVNNAMALIESLAAKKVEAADRAVKAATDEVNGAKSALQQEIENRNAGFAHRVEAAQKELDEARKSQKVAERDREKAIKKQRTLDALSQTSSLITATANIWKSATDQAGVWGTVLAVLATGTMWGSFLASKAKANQNTKSESYGDGTVELLSGGSHQSGNDVDLGRKPDGTRRRAEGGEYFAVVNKRNSRKFGKLIPDVINSFNDGSFLRKYTSSFSGGLIFNEEKNLNLGTVENDVRTIRKQSERRTRIDDGVTVTEYKNLTRKSK